MKKKELFQNQLKQQRLKKLLFFLLLPFFMHSQTDRINSGGIYYCSNSISEIIKKNKKVKYHVLPDEFVVDSINYRTDSSYVFNGKRKFLQMICFSDKFKFRIRNSVDQLKKEIYVQDLINNKKGKIEFLDFCDIKFIGIKILADKFATLYFEARYDGYEDFFSVKFYEDSMILNFDLPKYKKCD
jgi:hypothetical protein